MPTKKPRTTVCFDFDDYKDLQRWAKSEFRSIPQMMHTIVKKTLIQRKADVKLSSSSQSQKTF